MNENEVVEAQVTETAVTPEVEAAALVEQMDKLNEALTLAQDRVQEAERELREARAALGTEQLDRMLEGGGAGDGPAAERYRAAVQQLDAARATISAIRKRQAEAEIPVLTQAGKLKAERELYNEQTVAAFFEGTLKPVLDQLAVVLAMAAGLEEALDAVVPQAHCLPSVAPWQSVPEAAALHEQHVRLKDLAARLDTHRKEAGRRLIMREREKLHRPGFDPSGSYRVARAFKFQGEDFAVGRVVTKADIGLIGLGKLYTTKHLIADSDE